MASFWRHTAPSISEVLEQLHFVRECHQVRDLSINSFQAGLADSILLDVSSSCLTNLELGNLHEVTLDVLNKFFSSRVSRVKTLSLAYNPDEMPVESLLGLLTHTDQLRSLSLGLDSCTARTLRTRIAQIRRGWPPSQSLFEPEAWHFKEILEVVGSSLVALSLPFHGQWRAASSDLPKNGANLRSSLELCPNLEVLSFKTFFDDHSDPACRGTLQDCTLSYLIEKLPLLKMLDASKISITRQDFEELMDSPNLELVQLGYGAQERDVILTQVMLEGKYLRYDSGTKSLVSLSSQLSQDGLRFASKLQVLRTLEAEN